MFSLQDVSKFTPAICAVFGATIGGYRHKIFDKPATIYWYYTCIGAGAEVVARIAAMVFGNNMPVYTVYSPIELAAISLYFNYSIPALQAKNVGWYLGMLGVVASILNTILFQPLTAFNSYFLYFEGIVILSLSLYSFYRLVSLSDDLRLAKLRHFWFPFIQCSFWTITFLFWGLYEYFNLHVPGWSKAINISIGFLSGLTYLFIALIFWQYPKLKPTDE